MEAKSKALIIYFLTLGGIIIWLGIIFLAPYLKSRSSDLSPYLYACFSPICHQIPARSFYLFGCPLAVCCRCLGIYFGFLGGTILYPFLNGFASLNLPKVRTLILISLPVIIDTLGNFFRLWTTSDWLRFLTGFLWGLILPFYFIIGMTDILLRKKKERDVPQSATF